MTRRSVRVDQQFFSDLDVQLADTRGPSGEPSSSDFLLLDLPTIAEVFAESFDELPAMFDDRADYRYLLTTGSLVAAAVVVGQLVADGTIVLIGIELDLESRLPCLGSTSVCRPSPPTPR